MRHRVRRGIVEACLALVGALGLVVMLGWLLHSTTLVQLHPAFSPMQFNTALGFVLAALSGLAGQRSHWRVAAVLAVSVLLLGSLTLAQYLGSISLGIDQLFITPFTSASTTHPGRMAPNTAVAFVLCGAALAQRAVVQRRGDVADLTYPLLGATAACIGAVALVGYGLRLESAYGWAQYTRMALHTAAAFVVLGGSLVLDAWSQERAAGEALPPAVAGVAVGVVSLLLWGALEIANSRGLELAVQRLGQAAALRLADRLRPCHAGDVRLAPPAASPVQGPSAVYVIELPLAPGRPDDGCRNALLGLRASVADLQASVQPYLVLALVDADAVRPEPAPAARADEGEFALHIAATGLRLRVDAAPALIAEFRSPLPVLFLVCGLFLAGSTSLALAQLLRSRRQAGALGRVAAELRDEIARRDTLQQRLQSANQRLDDFAYIASHDLREPLRGLTNLAGFLLDDYGDRLDETGRQRLLALQGQARRMTGFIADLLEYSRAGAGGDSFVPVDLDALLSGVLERLGSELAALGVQLDRGGALGTVQGDPARLRMVFEYLIDNAARFSDRDDRQVTVGVRAGPPRTYTVTDNGIGIAEEHRERIFRMFTRLHHRDEYGGGSGAGLSIARKIVEGHGGRLWVESRADGLRGSVFCFTLGEHGPAPASPPPATETHR